MLLKCGFIVQWPPSFKGNNIFNISVPLYGKVYTSVSLSKEFPHLFNCFQLSYWNQNKSFIMQQQSCKGCRCADLQHFDSLSFQSVHESCFFEQVVEERQWKRVQLHIQNNFHQKASVKQLDFVRCSSDSVTSFLLQYWAIQLRNLSFKVIIRDSMVHRGKAQWDRSALKGSLHQYCSGHSYHIAIFAPFIENFTLDAYVPIPTNRQAISTFTHWPTVVDGPAVAQPQLLPSYKFSVLEPNPKNCFPPIQPQTKNPKVPQNRLLLAAQEFKRTS